MAMLRPVRPRGRRAAARGWLVAVLIVATIGAAIVKPWTWQDGSAPDASPAARPVPTAVIAAATPPPVATPRPAGPAGLPLFRSDIFGFVGRPPKWEVLVGLLIGDFSLAGYSNVTPVAPADLDMGTDPPNPAPDPLDLGPAGFLAAIAINHPATVTVHDLRLWRIPDDSRRPYRVPLVRLPAPTRNKQLEVIGIRLREGGNELTGWDPGRYRLDFLVGGEIRPVLSIALRADEGEDDRPEHGRQPPGSFGRDLAIIPSELRAGELFARGLLGDSIVPVEGDGRICRIADVWAAEHAGSPCRSTPVRLLGSLGVAVPAGTVATRASFRQIDPVRRPTDVGTLTLGATGRTVTVISSDQRPFPEGTYELDVWLEGGRHLRWYLEVQPGGGEVVRVGATH